MTVHLLASEDNDQDCHTEVITPSELPSHLRDIDWKMTSKDYNTNSASLSPKRSISKSKIKICVPSGFFVFWAAVISAIGGVLFGYDIGKYHLYHHINIKNWYHCINKVKLFQIHIHSFYRSFVHINTAILTGVIIVKFSFRIFWHFFVLLF